MKAIAILLVLCLCAGVHASKRTVLGGPDKDDKKKREPPTCDVTNNGTCSVTSNGTCSGATCDFVAVTAVSNNDSACGTPVCPTFTPADCPACPAVPVTCECGPATPILKVNATETPSPAQVGGCEAHAGEPCVSDNVTPTCTVTKNGTCSLSGTPGCSVKSQGISKGATCGACTGAACSECRCKKDGKPCGYEVDPVCPKR